MSEMLGNQYFMARKYDKALNEFEECEAQGKANKSMRKKMVVCYTQVGKIQKAAEVLRDQVYEDLDFILNTDPVNDDCPCSQLVAEMEAKTNYTIQSFDYLLALGILWLYCDLDKAVEYFKKAKEIKIDENVASILLRLKREQNAHKKFSRKPIN